MLSDLSPDVLGIISSFLSLREFHRLQRANRSTYAATKLTRQPLHALPSRGLLCLSEVRGWNESYEYLVRRTFFDFGVELTADECDLLAKHREEQDRTKRNKEKPEYRAARKRGRVHLERQESVATGVVYRGGGAHMVVQDESQDDSDDVSE